jgi:PAS domain S-box-containing protein
MGSRTVAAQAPQRDEPAGPEQGDDRFARFMANLPGLAWIKDHEGRYIYANQAAQEAFGKSGAELYGKTDVEIFPPATADQFRANDRAALTGVDVKVFETLTHPDGVPHYSVVRKFLIRGPAGKPDLLGGIAIDITELKRAEAALRESDQRFRLLADAAPVLIWMSGPDRRCTWFNKPWLDFVGRSLEQEVARGRAESVHPEDFDRCLETYVAAFDNRWPFSMDYRLKRRDGEYRWVLDNGIPLYGPNDEFTGYIGSCIDITERKRWEEELRESEERYRALVESQAEMLCRFRPDGTILFANSAYARARGTTPETLLASNFWDFVAEADRAAVREMLARLTPESPEVRIENRFQTVDGERWTLWTNRALKFDADGRLLEAQSTGIDITERKQAEENQRSLTNELNHRVKNTLAVVQSIAAQTARFTPDPEAFNRAFSDRVVALARVHDLLTRSAWRDASLAELATACLAAFRGPDADIVRIEGPPVRLSPNAAVSISLALHELATNAAKHGALKARAGYATLMWRVEDGDKGTLDLVWAEHGGPPVEPPTRMGFGSRLVAGLALQLNAEVSHEFAREGVRCRIRMALGRGRASVA